jgi:hypothetical protein
LLRYAIEIKSHRNGGTMDCQLLNTKVHVQSASAHGSQPPSNPFVHCSGAVVSRPWNRRNDCDLQHRQRRGSSFAALHDLVRIYTEFPGFPGGGLHKFWVSEPEVFDLQSARSFESLGAWNIVGANLSGDERPIRVTTAYVSSQILPMLRVPPKLGRWIPPNNDKPGAPQAMVISEALWKSHFAGDKGVVGKQTYLNGAKCAVVGIMPDGFVFPPGEADQPQVWAALQLDPKSQNRQVTTTRFWGGFAQA